MLIFFSEALGDSWRKACDDTDTWAVIIKRYVMVFMSRLWTILAQLCASEGQSLSTLGAC